VTIRVGFLRAVNLGKRTVSMARLVEIVEGLGHQSVWTHINSGNVVFDADGSRADVENGLETAFESAFGFEVTTFVRTPAELKAAVAARPFEVAEGDTHFLTLLKTRPTASERRALEALSNDFDTLVVDGLDVHWRMHGKSTDSLLKTKDWEQIIGRNRSTSRNLTMLRKLVAKLEGR
jgi:uncharacterized protein (DUF1697 family)